MPHHPEKERTGWRQDHFASNEVLGQFLGWLPLVIGILAASIVTSVWLLLKPVKSSSVVIYTSQDQQFAEPILTEFTRQTGIKVSAVYDSEAVKTVGLANRLLAESSHPQCDVWWSNEALRTRQLAKRGVFDTNFL